MLSRNMTNRAGNMVSNWFQTVTWTMRIKEPRRRRENHFNQFKSLLNAGRISSKIVVASSLHFYPGVGMINSFAVGMILMGDDGVGHQSVADSVTTTNCSPLPPHSIEFCWPFDGWWYDPFFFEWVTTSHDVGIRRRATHALAQSFGEGKTAHTTILIFGK